ncbi:hypothetical protein SETIT_2G391500v2 [Setaria italica]|uniref:Uncharacterized protein n=1 Tax=Setaria italica TaxID=4555 RepID=A0A368Q848_SETIT|nr:hypothetical protein SETIT_2G391500v2 [Setaria italica]
MLFQSKAYLYRTKPADELWFIIGPRHSILSTVRFLPGFIEPFDHVRTRARKLAASFPTPLIVPCRGRRHVRRPASARSFLCLRASRPIDRPPGLDSIHGDGPHSVAYLGCDGARTKAAGTEIPAAAVLVLITSGSWCCISFHDRPSSISDAEQQHDITFEFEARAMVAPALLSNPAHAAALDLWSFQNPNPPPQQSTTDLMLLLRWRRKKVAADSVTLEPSEQPALPSGHGGLAVSHLCTPDWNFSQLSSSLISNYVVTAILYVQVCFPDIRSK